MQEKEEIIILDNEITPPVIGNITIHEDKYCAPPVIVEDKILGKDGVWLRKNYIVGKKTMDDKKYCEPVSQLDLFNTIEIRKYILAVETYLTKKENKRSQEEGKNRMLKYLLCFGLGMSGMLWALYAGMINLTK
jgi:hypothetical protein